MTPLIGLLSLVCLATAYFAPAGIAFVASVMLFSIAFYRTPYYLMAILFFIPFDRLALLIQPKVFGQEEVATYIFTIPKVMLLFLFTAWAVKVLVTRDDRFLKSLGNNPVTFLLYALMLFSLASIFNTSNQTAWIVSNLRYLSSLLFFLAIVVLIENKRLLYDALQVLWVAGFFIALMGLFEVITRQHIIAMVGYPMPEIPFTLQIEKFRVAGPAGDPHFHAVAVILFAILSLAFLFLAKSKLMRLLFGAAFALFLINLIGTESRGGFLSMSVAIGVFLLFLKTRHKGAIVGGVVLLMVVTLLGYNFFVSEGAVQGYFLEARQITVSYRLGWWQSAVEMILDHPLIGVGTMNFPYASQHYRNPMMPQGMYVTHNHYLQVASENGLPALLVYIGIYLFILKSMYTVMKHAEDPLLRHIALTIMASVAGLGVMAGNISVTGLETYWITFALSVVVYNIFKAQEFPSRPSAVTA